MQAVTLNGSGILTVTTWASALLTTLALEWGDYTPRWQNYEVLEFMVHFFPRWPVNTGMAINLSHSVMFSSTYTGPNAPATLANVRADYSARHYITNKAFTVRINNSKSPNARLQNPTNAAMPTANQLGIALATSDLTNYLPVSVPVGQVYLEWKVKFYDYQ